MHSIYLKEVTEMLDIDKIDDYNQEFINLYPDWKPFVTQNNFQEYLKLTEEKKRGIDQTGLKEIYYWFIEDEKIIGSGSIRLNPEIDETIELYGDHIFYQVVPSKRNQGYGTILCHLLLENV